MPENHDPSDTEVSKLLGLAIRAERLNQSLSIQKLAELAAVSVDTIVRLERGDRTTDRTREKICHALGGELSRMLLRPKLEAKRGERITTDLDQDFATHRKSQELYQVLVAYRNYPEPPDESARIQNERERRRLGRVGHVTRFVKMLDCRLPEGKLFAGELEIYGRGVRNSYRVGELFVYVLEGAIRYFIGDESFDLHEGDAATIRCHDRDFGCELLEDGKSTVARILYVRLAAQ